MAAKIRELILPLTSLFVAFSALWYNTWRNEMSERNRNVRAAGFEIIKDLAALQLVANYAHYAPDGNRGNTIAGWSEILLIEDLAMVMPDGVQRQAHKLHDQWEVHVGQLQESEADNDAVIAEISNTREIVLSSLKDLR
ncbi:hypothetical protein GCM10025771_03530 [Niveibacterium umoris]|uniref:CHASE3 domain-containing protein n=1 Tax=Niveibacterium umoris TaxID=1193620 RepID=A0A840BLI5_9RHOO|nr:hypothetical protein [Niveibacterium umoris]MBB4014105.1 hypothetical protein [Niveibacterium umoris]